MEKTGFLDLYSDVNVTFYVFICFHLVASNVALFNVLVFHHMLFILNKKFQKRFHQTVV